MNEHDNHTTGKLAEALAKVQSELPDLDRDRTVTVTQKNGGQYSYSYVTLANLSKAVLPIMAANGLAYTALPGTGSDGKMCLRYHLLHTSGERLDGEFPISGEGGIQMVGGRITYARRYCLAAIVGVAADEDDESQLAHDGAPRSAQRAAQPRKTTPAPAKKTAQRNRPASEPPPLPGETGKAMSQAERGKMMALFGELGISDKTERLATSSEIVGRNLDSANDMTRDERSTLIAELESRVASLAEPDIPEDNFSGDRDA